MIAALSRALPALAAVLLAGLVLGCAKRPEFTGEEGLASSQLHDIWGFYQLHQEQHKSPPSKLEDVEEYAIGYATGFDAVRAGDYVVQWGVALTEPGDADSVLAYHRNVPVQGGLILMRNGSIKRVTAAEFQALAKGR